LLAAPRMSDDLDEEELVCAAFVGEDPLWLDVHSDGGDLEQKERELMWRWDVDEGGWEQSSCGHDGENLESVVAASRVMTVTATSRSINLKPGIFFLGEGRDPTAGEEVSLFETTCIENVERNEVTLAQALAGESAEHANQQGIVEEDSRQLLRWVLDEQRSFEDRVKKFVRSQREQLALHQHHAELHTLHLRVQVQQALKRRSGLSAAGDVGATTSVCLGPVSDVTGSVTTLPGDSSPTFSVPWDSSSSQEETWKPEVWWGDLPVDRASGSMKSKGSLEIQMVKGFTCHGPSKVAGKDKIGRLRSAFQAATMEEPESPFFFERFMTQKSMILKERSFFGKYKVVAENLVDSIHFKFSVAAVIVLNALFIGIISDLSVKSSINSYDNGAQRQYADILQSGWSVAVDLIFSAVFLVELSLRVVALEWSFFNGPEWKWNLFDTLIVILCVGEMFLIAMGFNPSFLRILRLVRVIRSVRMLRLMRFTGLIRRLRMLSVAIMNCSTMLMWAVTILFLVMFSFSVVFINAASQYISDAGESDENIDNMKLFFGSLPMAILTLFMAVAGGIDWWDVVKLLLDIHILYACLFLLFVVMTVLAVMNVINAIFVNDAIETTRMDMDLRMQCEMTQNQYMLDRLTVIFRQLTGSHGPNPKIEMSVFVELVEEDRIKLQLSMLGLHFTDGEAFFKLLDMDGNGELGMDEFVMGCLRLKSGAILIDINVMLEDTRRLVLDLIQENRLSISLVANRVDAICKRLKMKTDKRQSQ